MHQKDYIEIRTEALGVWAYDLIPNFAINGKGSKKGRVISGHLTLGNI